MNYKKTIPILFVAALSSCAGQQITPQNNGSCKIKDNTIKDNLVKSTNMSEFWMDETKKTVSNYDKDSSDITTKMQKEIYNSSVEIHSSAKVDGKLLSWKGSGTAFINPKTEKEYVLTLFEVIIPKEISSKKYKFPKITINGLETKLDKFSKPFNLALLEVNCPQTHCLKPYQGKIVPVTPRVSDYTLGIGHNSPNSTKTTFSGKVKSLDNVLNQFPLNIEVKLDNYSNAIDLGAGVFVFKEGKSFYVGPVMKGNAEKMTIPSTSIVRGFFKRAGLRNYLE